MMYGIGAKKGFQVSVTRESGGSAPNKVGRNEVRRSGQKQAGTMYGAGAGMMYGR